MVPALFGAVPVDPEELGMGEHDKPPSLEDLETRLRAARDRRRPAGSGNGAGKGGGSDIGAGIRVAVDLVAGVAVGVALGLILDNWLGTKPWMLIVFFILGSAAGFLNLYRTAQQFERERRDKEEHGS